VQQHRAENHFSIAMPCEISDLVAIGITRGADIEVAVGASRERAYFHGTIAMWSQYSRYFGDASAEAIARDYALEAYVESSLTMGGVKVPGHTEWLRVRATSSVENPAHAILDAAVGSTASVRLLKPGPAFKKIAAARMREGALEAQVLASHPHGLVLAFDAIGLRRLGAHSAAWYRLELGDEVRPLRGSRSISLQDDEAVWERTTALLFKFIAHWDDERKTVCYVTPMQHGWKGRFPMWQSITMPVVTVDERVRITAE
jgi:hypothetical protein